MLALDYRKMERLSDLFAQGALRNASEIAKLVRTELGKKPDRLADIDYCRERVFKKLAPSLRKRPRSY